MLGILLLGLGLGIIVVTTAFAVLTDLTDNVLVILSLEIWAGFALFAGIVLLTNRQDSNEMRQVPDPASAACSSAMEEKVEQPVSEAKTRPLTEEAPSVVHDLPKPVGQDEATREDNASWVRSEAIEPDPPPSSLAGQEESQEVPAGSIEDIHGLLIQVWRDYLENGDGHFNVRGLRKHLVQHGIEADVLEGPGSEAGGNVLVVDPKLENRYFYVLPSFAKPPSAVQDWYEDASGGGLMARIRNVRQLAVGRWTDGGFEVVERGAVS